jgi:hypothetical protein
MLVSNPSLPVLQYLWSSSRTREPLLRNWQFHSRKHATNPLPLSTWRYGAVHRNMCTGRWDIWIPPPVTRVRIEVFNAGESHANSTAYGGIFRDHATPTSTHGAQEGRFSGALYPEYPTLQLPSYHCGGSQGHAWR